MVGDGRRKVSVLRGLRAWFACRDYPLKECRLCNCGFVSNPSKCNASVERGLVALSIDIGFGLFEESWV